ncbi:GNAT family N-acetyltransferase [Candidatus Bipolaricaulota bacterium]
MPAEDPQTQIRPASIADLESLVALRVTMFEAMGYESQALVQSIDSMCDYFEKHLPSGAFRVWVAEHKGTPIASIGLVIHSIPPSPHNAVGKEAYLMNLVTLPEYRRQGIAKRLLRHVVDIVRSEGIQTVSLHASSEGRRLYEELGFVLREDVPEMVLKLTA